MAIESEVLSYALNNGIGVLAFVLMWIMANTTIKENTKSNIDLKDAILMLTEKLNGKKPN